MNKYIKLTVLASSLGLGACSQMLNIGEDDYGCVANPDQVNCMSSRHIYEATNDKDALVTMLNTEEGQEVSLNDPKVKKQIDKIKANLDKEGVNSSGSENKNIEVYSEDEKLYNKYLTAALPDGSIPIRTNAQIMRIWLNSWENTDGDLNLNGYVLTEIEPRRWSIADKVRNGGYNIRSFSSTARKPK